MLIVNKITYRIGDRPLLNGVSFEAKAGELLALIGPNGAGKSTLLKLCARELTPTSGTIHIRNQPLNQYRSDQLALFRGMLHQQNPVTFPFRVGELVLMGRYPHGGTYPTPTDQAIADETLQTVGMRDFSDRVVSTLSGGEQQRVHLARVLAQVWDVPNGLLLLDEPITGLDLRHQHGLLTVARQMARRGYAVVVVLHDLNIAAQYADQLLLLNAGRREAYGTPADVLTPPLIERVFGLSVQRLHVPQLPYPLLVPTPDSQPAISH